MTSVGFAPIPTNRHSEYTTRYRCRGADEDYAVHTHGNGISVLTLAPTHPIRRLQKKVEKIIWSGVSGKVQDRSQNKVTGKRKKGGITLEPNSVLCQVTCVDGTKYDIRATVHGSLIETNDALRGDPSLIGCSDADGVGFLALFALSAKHRVLLSVEDRAAESSEAERDIAAAQRVNRDPDLALPTAPATSKETIGSEAGADWRSHLEYLKPAAYLDRRRHMFLQTSPP